LTKDKLAIFDLRIMAANDSSPPRSGPVTNRLAPYNPTHETAQSVALDLLALTHGDIFFDLGCGDGRLVLAALERCYDDDYLLDVHRRRFHRAGDDDSGGGEEEHSEPLAPPRAASVLMRRSVHGSTSQSRSDSAQSQSQYSIPHLMRTSSHESDEDESKPAGAEAAPCRSGRGGLDQSGRSRSTPRHDHPARGALEQGRGPPSPVTPVITNSKRAAAALGGRAAHPLFAGDLPAVNSGEEADPLGVPATIETPPTPRHVKTISDLPVEDHLCDSDVKPEVVTPLSAVRRDGLAHRVECTAYRNADGGGLMAVGIEYNQALAEAAQRNLERCHLHAHVEDRTLMRWGDVLDEWGDYRQGLTLASGGGRDIDGHDNFSAQGLNLIRDATAVFVYLLPKGLKKIKPLLYEAARLRHAQRQQARDAAAGSEESTRETDLENDEEDDDHPLLRLGSCDALDGEVSRPNHIEPAQSESTEPSTPTRLTHCRKESIVSELTDYDFRTRTGALDEYEYRHRRQNERSSSRRHGGAVERPPREEAIPKFRVVSYMFSLPGWKPKRVDKRGSKGGCPLYLYEDIHLEEDEWSDLEEYRI